MKEIALTLPVNATGYGRNIVVEQDTIVAAVRDVYSIGSGENSRRLS